MKLEIFTKTELAKWANKLLFSTLFVFLLANVSYAQCPLVANDLVQVSLDEDCSVEITPEMILEGETGQECPYKVIVLGPDGQPVPGTNVVNNNYVNMTLTAEVHLGDNKTWGLIKIEDKLAPTIDCVESEEVWCFEEADLTPPNAVDNCTEEVTVNVLSDEVDDLDCPDAYSAVRTIKYQAVDASGNKSAICTRVINYKRITLKEVMFPKNYDDTEDDKPSLACDNIPEWDKNNNGYPDPEETGAPFATSLNEEGEESHVYLYPSAGFCEMNVTFHDEQIPICEGSYKVLRTWKVLDWCTGDIKTEHQVIKVIDNKAPQVTCAQENIQVGASAYECKGTWNVVAPEVTDACSSTSYKVDYQYADQNGNFPAENGGNYTSEHVTTNSNGTYKISHLPLGLTKVRYTVTDDCGNVAHCYSVVEVVDDIAPYAICKEFTVTSLTTDGTSRVPAASFDDESYDNCSNVRIEVRRMTNNCSDTTWNVFKPYVDFCCADVAKSPIMIEMRVTDAAGNSNTCMVEARVEDKIAPWIQCPDEITIHCGQDVNDLDVTGRPTYGDNCETPTLTHTDLGSLDQCGVGHIRRVFKVTDSGNRSVTCTQDIWVIDQNPFTYDDITWPADTTFVGCMVTDVNPETTGKPTYNDDECSLVASTYEDQLFTFSEDACYKILRKWTVIDWCTYDQNATHSGGYWQKTQIIKLNNAVKPKFDSCKDYTVGIYGADCKGAVTFAQSATDDCTAKESLKYYFEIDLNGDGVITKADTTGHKNSVTLNLAPGKYKVWWKVEDLCGNVERCEQLVTVVDAKKPTPYCLGEVTTVVMPSSMMIDIWASDFNLGSYDNCPGELKYSFSKDVKDTRRVFTCAEVGENSLDMWVTDAAGNQDYCTVTINIQPNQACGQGRVSGKITTEYSAPVREVEVTLNKMNSTENQTFMTTENGVFQFTSLNNNSDYMVAPQKNSDARNGVNTRDLIAIQRHLLGLEKLNSPYKIIAADANKDNKVNPQDLFELRKLILKIDENFKHNTSWRFVKSDFVFTNPNKPFIFDEQIEVKDVGQNSTDENFIAVKIGDVNGSADLNLDAGVTVETRSQESMVLAYDHSIYTEGEVVEVPVYAGTTAKIAGLQYEAKLGTAEVLEVRSGAMDIEASNYNVVDGTFAFSWNTAMSSTFDRDEVLFTVILKATEAGSTSDLFRISENDIKAEAYDVDLSIMDLTIEARNHAASYEFAVEQNNPNPFAGSTVVEIQLPEAGNVDFAVFNLTGQRIFAQSKDYTSGKHAIILDGETITTNGVMYYQVTYGGKTITKKMISIGK